MEDTVLLTGFCPFGLHQINSSWESVKLLQDTKINDCLVKTVEIPVVYTYVQDNIRRLWNEYKPKLVVHVGVSSFTKKLQLEQQANRTGYFRNDTLGNQCKSYGYRSSNDDCIETSIDLMKLCDYVQNNCKDVEICISNDAGRYLCEFTYYASLCISRTRTLFVHVPPLEKPYRAEELAEGIRYIIRGALEQISNDEKYCVCSDK